MTDILDRLAKIGFRVSSFEYIVRTHNFDVKTLL